MTETETGVPVADCLQTDGRLDIEQAIETAGVDYAESTYEHDDPDHCEAAAAGRVVVGVTNVAVEVLLVVDTEREYALLPNGIVDPADSFLDVARETVEELLQATVSVDTIHRVRRIDHRADETRRQQTTHVVVSATPTEMASQPRAPANEVFADWFDRFPVEPDAVGDGLADMRLFLPE